jgi:hypothetical protein
MNTDIDQTQNLNMPEQVERALVERIDKDRIDPVLPQVAGKVMALVNDPAADAARLSALIHRDQALAAHVLRIANSPAYMPRTPIASLQHAVAMLGVNQLSEIAVTISLKSVTVKIPGHEADVRQLWRHALASGAYAKEIARMRRYNVESAYLCGLLHAVGKPVVLKTVTTIAAEMHIPPRFQCDHRLPRRVPFPHRQRNRERFNEIARGQISGIQAGLLKLVADPTGEYILGVQIIGEGATELIHIGQMALQHAATVDSFVETIFNYPTLAETYRVAALDIVGQRQKRLASIAA